MLSSNPMRDRATFYIAKKKCKPALTKGFLSYIVKSSSFIVWSWTVLLPFYTVLNILVKLNILKCK